MPNFETLQDWFVGTVKPSKTDFVVLEMRRHGLKVVNFRKEEQETHRGQTLVVARPMFAGYLFLRGKAAPEIVSLPFAPRLMRSEDEFRTVRAAKLKELLDGFGGSLWKLSAQHRARIDEERRLRLLKASEDIREVLGSAFRVKEPVLLQA